MSSPSNDDVWIVYDGQCPFCSNYMSLVRLRQNIGSVRLIDARDKGEEVDEIQRAGISLDEGMVLKLGGRLFHGAECVHMIALLSENAGLFNRFNIWLFRSASRSRVIYPILRFFRNVTLRILGRDKIGS